MLKNPEETTANLIEWIRSYMDAAGENKKVVVGVSGGKDSSCVAALCEKAIGKDRVFGVMMPCGEQADIADSQQLIDFLQIPHATVNIGPAFDAFKNTLVKSLDVDKLSSDCTINIQPRLRMTTLYAVAQNLSGGARVVNTCNRSEDYVGYSTKFGDAAGDFSPLANLLVSEVRQIGRVLGIPSNLIEKTPSDGLSGMSDEDKLGFTYEELDNYILTGECADQAKKERIEYLHNINLHKLQLMPAFEPGVASQRI